MEIFVGGFNSIDIYFGLPPTQDSSHHQDWDCYVFRFGDPILNLHECHCYEGGGQPKVLFSLTVPTKTQLSNFLGTPGEDYLKGNPKSLNCYFLVIWWGKLRSPFQTVLLPVFLRR